MVFKSTNEKIPYFNAPAFLENKQKIGKVDEIFGPINEVMFTVKPDQGIVATSWKVNDKVYISPDRLLPLTRFTNPRKPSGGKRGGRGGRGGGRGGRGRGRGRGRGGRGGRGRGRGSWDELAGCTTCHIRVPPSPLPAPPLTTATCCASRTPRLTTSEVTPVLTYIEA